MTLPDQLRAAQVSVKPLVWNATRGHKWQADGLGIWYQIELGDDPSTFNADHAARIRAALAPDPLREAMIEAVALIQNAISALNATGSSYQMGVADELSVALARTKAALETNK